VGDGLEAFLREAVASRASDLHLAVGLPPMVRVDGRLLALDRPRLTEGDVGGLVFAVLTEEQKIGLKRDLELDFAYSSPDGARFRGNAHFGRGVPGAVFRVIPDEVPRLKDLGLPRVVEELTDETWGLVLVTGPTGSGKSTTLAAMLAEIIQRRQERIVTVEDPIEFLHPHGRCVVTQREVGSDARTFARALRHVLRQDPDVILVGEMRDLETTEIALEAAETGHLVISTLHTIDASKTIDRIIGLYPKNDERVIRTRLAQTFRYIVSQRLIPRADGKGRIAAVEILKSNPRTREYIEKGESEGKTLLDAIRDGELDGMQDFDSVIRKMIEAKTITLEDGMSYATNQNNLLLQLKGLSSTEDYLNAGKIPSSSPTAPVVPQAMPKSSTSVLDMIE